MARGRRGAMTSWEKLGFERRLAQVVGEEDQVGEDRGLDAHSAGQEAERRGAMLIAKLDGCDLDRFRRLGREGDRQTEDEQQETQADTSSQIIRRAVEAPRTERRRRASD